MSPRGFLLSPGVVLKGIYVNQIQIAKGTRDTLQACHDFLIAAESYLDREDLTFEEKILNALKMISFESMTQNAMFQWIKREWEKE